MSSISQLTVSINKLNNSIKNIERRLNNIEENIGKIADYTRDLEYVKSTKKVVNSYSGVR